MCIIFQPYIFVGIWKKKKEKQEKETTKVQF